MSAHNAQILKKIVNADNLRSVLVVSAIGKEHNESKKITDMLLNLYATKNENVLESIRQRFYNYCTVNKITCNAQDIVSRAFTDYQNFSMCHLLSLGEEITAKIFSAYLNYEYVESEKLFLFEKDKCNYEKSYKQIKKHLSGKQKVVLGGFYGADSYGNRVTFERGGSDISGAIVAAALGAVEYENFSDVPGFYICSPKLVANSQKVNCLSYSQLRLLNQIGADVLHRDAVLPLIKKGIPLHLLSYNNYSVGGTVIGRIRSMEKLLGITRVSVAVAQSKKLFSDSLCAVKTDNYVEQVSLCNSGKSYLYRLVGNFDNSAFCMVFDVLKQCNAKIFFCALSSQTISVVTSCEQGLAQKLYDALMR